jgi:large subunit ribosomal protein L12e
MANDWKGLCITIKLTAQNRQTKVSVMLSAAMLIIKTLKEPESDKKKVKNIKHTGNLSLNDIIKIAKIMKPWSMAKEFAGTVRQGDPRHLCQRRMHRRRQGPQGSAAGDRR